MYHRFGWFYLKKQGLYFQTIESWRVDESIIHHFGCSSGNPEKPMAFATCFL